MKITDLKAEDIFAGTNWILKETTGNPEIFEAIGFTAEDIGLFSAIVRLADMSEHPALVVRSFPQGGEDVDVYVLTKFGWLSPQAPGFMRAIGKYSHEIFPFDWFLAEPWKGGKQPLMDKASPHVRIFKDAVARLKSPSPSKR